MKGTLRFGLKVLVSYYYAKRDDNREQPVSTKRLAVKKTTVICILLSIAKPSKDATIWRLHAGNKKHGTRIIRADPDCS